MSNIRFSEDQENVIIIFFSSRGDYLTVVWNLEENIEKFNMSTPSCPHYFYGQNSRFGYLWCQEFYINLDLGLKNYFFEYSLNDSANNIGYLMNKREDLFLHNTMLITKETLVEVNSLDNYLKVGSGITKNNINLERIRFQVDNNTMIHYFALEYDTLTTILDYMGQHKPGYLMSILMPNSQGRSALDITIANESPKNTEALLLKLLQFGDQKLSHLFSHNFTKLLKMNIKAFNEYLDSCFFQTNQMKSIDNLQFKQGGDPVLVPHNWCLIDDFFVEAHCSNLSKRVIELQKVVRENKQKELLKHKATLQRQITNREAGEEEKSKPQEGEDILEEDIQDLEDFDDPDGIIDDIITTKQKVSKEEILLKKIQTRQKKVVVKAIEFDWLFDNIRGPALFQVLTQIKNIEVFSISLIRYIIIFFWGYFRYRIMLFLFIPFLIYFGIFLAYSTWFQKQKITKDQKGDEGFGLACTISAVLILGFVIKEAYYETRQIMYHKMRYFASFWNIIDVLSLLLNFVIWIGEFGDMNSEDLTLITSIAVLLMYLKLFYFGRIFLATASLVSMVIEITKDMGYFLMVFIIGVAGFGNWYLILQRNIEDGIFDGDTYWNAFIFAYQNSLGDFNTDGFAGTDKYYLSAIWFMNVLIALIVLLNLLIAIMGDTFDRVMENSENNMLRELGKFIL